MTAPSFLVDECPPADVTFVIRESGFDVTDLVERGKRGTDDRAVWALAAAEGRILVTRDLDFPLRDVLPRPAGLVLLRSPDDATAIQLSSLMATLLGSLPLPELIGRITVVSRGRYRQRTF